jgi:hypothetical protein
MSIMAGYYMTGKWLVFYINNYFGHNIPKRDGVLSASPELYRIKKKKNLSFYSVMQIY